jgi:hypothetical protein
MRLSSSGFLSVSVWQDLSYMECPVEVDEAVDGLFLGVH